MTRVGNNHKVYFENYVIFVDLATDMKAKGVYTHMVL
jgi:hypothetical protein